jgi:hypothetical protein
MFKSAGSVDSMLGTYGVFGCRKAAADKQWQLMHFVIDVQTTTGNTPWLVACNTRVFELLACCFVKHAVLCVVFFGCSP